MPEEELPVDRLLDLKLRPLDANRLGEGFKARSGKKSAPEQLGNCHCGGEILLQTYSIPFRERVGAGGSTAGISVGVCQKCGTIFDLETRRRLLAKTSA